jgi:phenylpyruvate tautomerase PptA (4-oxalocrotonate tautomerase family)
MKVKHPLIRIKFLEKLDAQEKNQLIEMATSISAFALANFQVS